MTNDTMLPFSFPAVCAKKITAAFDGGRISSDGGVMLLAQAEHRLGIAEKLAAVITDPRDPMRVVHLLPDILRARMLAIACGYEDADDLDRLRFDPAFKLACGRLPDTGRDLCSQPTMSRFRWEPFDLSSATVLEAKAARPTPGKDCLGIKLGDKLYWSVREAKPDGHDAYTIGQPTRATSAEAA
jgi:hypothetical protein